MFNNIISNLNEGVKKFLLYSGNYINVDSVNVAFGIVSFEKDFEKWKAKPNKHRSAPFASTIFIEVYRDE